MKEQNTNTPLIQSETQPQSKKTRSEHCALSVFCWIFTIGSWIFIAMLVFTFGPFPDITIKYSHKNKNVSVKDLILKEKYIYIGLGVYIIYLLLELCSPIGKYLCNKISGQGIYSRMASIFKAVPTFTLYCECYHIETEEYTVTDEDGNTHTETRSYEVVTYRETYHIPYYCCRDVSGLFILNTDEKHIKKKVFVKLELKEEINFADAISYSDYIKEKENFRRRNEHRDQEFRMKEKKTKIEGLKHHHLIQIQNNSPCCVNFCWFFLFIILTFAQFYKWYIGSLCIYQNYTIRKLISTRYDLSTEEANAKYDNFNPQLNLITQHLSFEPNNYIYLSTSNKKQPPSNYELTNAEKYENLIPKYEIYISEDIRKSGTVKDNPDFINFNDNQITQEKNEEEKIEYYQGDIPLISTNIDYQKEPMINIPQNNENDENNKVMKNNY